MNDSESPPSYVVGHVPTGKTKRDWKLDITTEEQYNLAAASGLAWVVYWNFPLTWNECKNLLEEE